ncbi:ECF transporter S component [Limosilactobacillus caccae]|uniref:ECF transporter S component n=1 Tax=Limosilactobacillus caccae TaxID=1926284 RepID=UPI0009706487|nr:ECF transporter S component [Limosilactobacillus caccae]
MRTNRKFTRTIIGAMLLALTLVLGRFFLFPIPWTHGNVNLCDAGVFTAAMLLGPGAGTVVGGFGGLFLDLISGFPQDALFSFAAHGLEGLISGWIYKKYGQYRWGKWLAVLAGTIVMIAIYFICNSVMYHVITGFMSLGSNFIQGMVGGLVALVIIQQLKKRNINL